MKSFLETQARTYRLATVVGFAALLTILFVGSMTHVAQAQQFPAPGAGYLDYNYGTNVNGAGRTPTESKPESKLWWNDGFWWGSMWNPTVNQYHIYRLNWGTQTWEDTGVLIDERVDSRADTLWDGTKLYIASHFAQLNSSETNNPVNYAKLRRYSYNVATHTYTLDAGFPVDINHDKTEALTLAKDATGRLWITYVSRVSADPTPKYRVFVNAAAANDDKIWDINSPLDFITITDTAHVAVDDISAIVAFKDNGGSKVGILWSNQISTAKTSLNFAYHAAGSSDFKTGWTIQPMLNNLGGTNPQSKANDHMNIKSLQSDTTGQVFAAIKFENQVFNPDQPTFPEIGLLARDVDGTFVYRPYSLVADNDSRPLLLINEADTANNNDNVANVFVSGLPQGSKICYKQLALPALSAGLANLGQFPAGNCGTSFIVDASGVYTTFRDPSSTKQTVNNTTGIVVLASDVNGRSYAHNVLGNPPPVVTAYGPNGSPIAITAVVTATFSKPISNTTLNNSTFLLFDGATPVAGAITYNNSTRTATFTPNSPLKANATYTVKLTNGIKDSTGLALDAFKTPGAGGVVEQWTFTTGATTVQFARPTFSVPENGDNAIITVTLASVASQPVTVTYATSDGTATAGAGNDYTASSGTVTFTPGQTVKTFVVPILNDSTDENNEFVNLTLSSPAGASAGVPMTATLTIIDDEGAAAIQFAPTSYVVNENVAGGKVVVNVSLSHPSTSTITVGYATSDGTATAGQDYTAASGTLTFAAGDTSETFDVSIANDNIAESDEAFNLTLSNPTGAVVGTPDDKGTVTIKDTTGVLAVQFDAAPYTVDEGVGTTNITVKLSGPSATPVTVDYAIGNGTATSGTDYTATDGVITFAPGDTSKTFPITVINDAVNEGNETVNLTLSNANGATLGDPVETTLTINDNDAIPTLQFSASTYSVVENATKATITVQLSAPSGRPVGVNFISSDGTATDGTDYVGVDDSLIIPAGEISATFDIFLVNNTVAEGSETVNLAVSTTEATLGSPSTATLTILDDDAPPVVPTVQFSGVAYSVKEGAGTATITVTLSAATTANVTVNYATSNGTATAGDYTSTSGVLSFTTGQTIKTFTVPITQDTVNEGNETINLALATPGNATLGTAVSATLTIVDDDAVVTGSKVYLPLIKR